MKSLMVLDLRQGYKIDGKFCIDFNEFIFKKADGIAVRFMAYDL